ncbi:MAG: type VI secretion system lipoprotein TssJ [Azoarcus sp.]|jgi:type VI secretion system protein VasD|nr:type VI secretion system lipoprotein TssJ [Azoarcus sp.]
MIMRKGFNRSGCALWAVAAVFVTACASKKPAIPEALALQANVAELQRASEPPPVRAPEEYAIKGTAEAFVNRDAGGKPLSVVVRLYQLRGNKAFSRLGFDAVAQGQDEAELFPGEWLATNEVVLIPGRTLAFTDKLLPETQYIGGVALFRSPDAHGWRFLVDARAARNEGLNFTAKDCYFTAVQPEAEPVSDRKPGYAPECAAFILY